jgi:hypothetical protein
MENFDILWKQKYKQLDRRRSVKWFDNFSDKFIHSRWYSFREHTSNMYHKIYIGTVRYSVCRDRRYNMKMNFRERIIDNE